MRGLMWVLVLVWIVAVGVYAWQTWPVMSLDLGNDAETRAAYNGAVTAHAAYFAAIALAPPLLAWIVAKVMSR